MNEIYRDSIGKAASLSIPSAEVNSARFERNGTTVNATDVVETPAGYLVEIPYEMTHMDGDFTVIWDYSVDGKDYTRRETISVVTPLFTKDELVDSDPDFTSLTDAQVVKLERMIRQVIERYTGQTFGFKEGTLDLYGNGTRVLSTSGTRVHSITYLVPYGYSNPEQISGYAYGGRLVSDGYAIVKNAPNDYSIKADSTEVYESVIGGHLGYSANTFSNGSRYTLSGRFGYESVPQAVKDAALQLAQTYSCDEHVWRDRYVKSMRSADWRVDFQQETYNGTGSLIADQLLAPFIVSTMVVL